MEKYQRKLAGQTMVYINEDYLSKIRTVSAGLVDSYLQQAFDKSPLQSAYIYFFLNEQKQNAFNLDKLTAWANTFYSNKLFTTSFGKEKDKEITALFLISTTQRRLSKKDLERLTQLYIDNFSHVSLFFGNLSYSAIIHYCSYRFRGLIKNYKNNNLLITERYLNQNPFNHALGLQFFCSINTDDNLVRKIKDILETNTISYEKKLYLANALFRAKKIEKQIDNYMLLSKLSNVVSNSPVPLADAINQGDISNYSRSAIHDIISPISPYYVASLFSLSSSLENNINNAEWKRINNTYQQRGIFNRGFGFALSLLLLLPVPTLIKNILQGFYEERLVNPRFLLSIPLFILLVCSLTFLYDLGVKGKSEKLIFDLTTKRLIKWGGLLFGTIIGLGLIVGIIANKLSGWRAM